MGRICDAATVQMDWDCRAAGARPLGKTRNTCFRKATVWNRAAFARQMYQ